MTIDYVGSLTIGGCMPGAVAMSVASQADIEARLAALLSFAPAPISFEAQLVVAVQTLAGVQAAMLAALTLGFQPPSIDLQIALILAQIAELTASLSIIATFGGWMATAGVHLYTFDGTAENLGNELAAETEFGLPGGGPTDHVNALILATSSGAAWAAMSSVFQVT